MGVRPYGEGAEDSADPVCTTFTLAEPVRGARHRFDPGRVHGSRHPVRATASAASAAGVRRLLQRMEAAPVPASERQRSLHRAGRRRLERARRLELPTFSLAPFVRLRSPAKSHWALVGRLREGQGCRGSSGPLSLSHFSSEMPDPERGNEGTTPRPLRMVISSSCATCRAVAK